MNRKRNREREVFSSPPKDGKSWTCTLLLSVCISILFFSIAIEGKSHQADSVIYNFLAGASD